MKYLPESQTQAFNVEYMKEDRWLWFKGMVEEHFRDTPIRVLDIGGGNGIFADKILNAFPHAEVVLLDCSENLLKKNTEHPRKHLVLESVENLQEVFAGEKFDVITLNLVLHHLVGMSYRESRKNVLNTLAMAQNILSDDGRIFVCENMYNGLVVDSFPSRCIYKLTSIRNPLVVKLFRRWGANTAGTGVCFQSRKMWHRVMRQVGLKVARYEQDAAVYLKKSRIVALHVRSNFLGYFWLAKQDSDVLPRCCKLPKKVA
ncbi:MAG: class I SAM-dependent methyltransferase [Planctomycetia bacterium]